MTYRLVILAGRVLFALLGLRIDLRGERGLPARGPALLAANHVSFLDFLVVGLVGVARGRRVRFLARHDLWQHPVAGFLLTRMGHIPVDRSAPAHAYLLARAALRRGEVVGVFPEAGVSTSYTVRDLMPGAVALAAETGAPLLPVAVWGPQRLLSVDQPFQWRRALPVSVSVSAPWHVAPHEDVRRMTVRLGHRLQTMVEELQVRPEHRPASDEHAPWYPRHLGGHAPSVEEAQARASVPVSALVPRWGPSRGRRHDLLEPLAHRAPREREGRDHSDAAHQRQ